MPGHRLYNEKPKPRRRSHIGKRPLTACRDSDLRSNNFATMPVYAQRFAREELRISSVFQSSTDWIHLHEPNKTMIQTPLPRISDVFAQMSPDDFHLHPTRGIGKTRTHLSHSPWFARKIQNENSLRKNLIAFSADGLRRITRIRPSPSAPRASA